MCAPRGGSLACSEWHLGVAAVGSSGVGLTRRNSEVFELHLKQGSNFQCTIPLYIPLYTPSDSNHLIGLSMVFLQFLY